jgi:hypothetical protein
MQLYATDGYRTDVIMSVPDLNKLADALQQNKLTSEQEAQLSDYLAAHPDQRARWEEEIALNQLLRQVPDVPVSSNFTALVLGAVRQTSPRSPFQSNLCHALFVRHWQAKLASALMVVSVGVLTYHEHELTLRRDLARNLVEMSKLTAGTPLELIVNFDAIERLNQVPVTVDRELVAALQ